MEARTAEAQIEHEAQLMGRRCTLLNRQTNRSDGHTVDFLVYRTEASGIAHEQLRFAVYVDGRCATSGIVS